MRRRSDTLGEVSRNEVQTLLGEGAQIVDVRPEAGSGRQHIAGAINLPLKALDAQTAASGLRCGRPVVVY